MIVERMAATGEVPEDHFKKCDDCGHEILELEVDIKVTHFSSYRPGTYEDPPEDAEAEFETTANEFPVELTDGEYVEALDLAISQEEDRIYSDTMDAIMDEED